MKKRLDLAESVLEEALDLNDLGGQNDERVDIGILRRSLGQTSSYSLAHTGHRFVDLW